VPAATAFHGSAFAGGFRFPCGCLRLCL
jgi:hypothetical protein